MKKTEWFPGHIKPVHVGVYETEDASGMLWFNCWTGAHWSWGVTSEGIAKGAWPKANIGYAVCQSRSWRGLTEKTS